MGRIISSRSRQRDSLLFVYGTLRPFVDIPMARWLRGVARYVGPAKTRGRLFDLGPYPGLVPAKRSGEWVRGDVYRVRSPFVLRVLDRYESGVGAGAPRFVRAPCEVVRLDGRRSRAAWMYVYQKSSLGRVRIVHGDYQFHRHGQAVS